LNLKVRREGAFPIGGIAMEGERFRGLLLGKRHGRGLAYVVFVEYGFTRPLLTSCSLGVVGLARATSPFAVTPDRAAVWLDQSCCRRSLIPSCCRAGCETPCTEG
jgi:hypothetical protein